MAILIKISIFGFMLVPLLLASMMPIRRAILVSFVGGYLFLPVFGVYVPGPLEISKLTIVPLSVLMTLMVYQPDWFTRPRVSWIDLPMFIWCLSPIPAVMAMDQGVYEMFAFTLDRLVVWGLPYWIGRAYFSEPKDAKSLAIAVFIGGLVYVPFCLFESRFSPQLHRIVYGYSQLLDYRQARRMGGWRPMVFLQHGLAIGLWMVAAALCGIILFRAKLIKQLPYAIGSKWALGLVLIGMVMTRSLGAIMMLAMVGGAIYVLRKYRVALPLILIALLPSLYVTVRVTNTWHGEEVVTLIRDYVSSARAASLDTRLSAEMLLMEKAAEQPFTGLGRFGDNRVQDSRTGQDIAITDSYWILAFGMTGLPSMYALMLMVGLPSVLVSRWVGRQKCPREDAAVLLALIGVGLLFTLDCLLNAMHNMVIILIIGAVSGAAVERVRWVTASARQPASEPNAPLTA